MPLDESLEEHEHGWAEQDRGDERRRLHPRREGESDGPDEECDAEPRRSHEREHEDEDDHEEQRVEDVLGRDRARVGERGDGDRHERREQREPPAEDQRARKYTEIAASE